MINLGLGTGDLFWDAPIDRNRKIDIIKEALSLGFRLIDTAENYGDSESLVGEAIKGIDSRTKIATKVSPQNLGKNSIYESCMRSIDILGIDQIPIFQIHWPNPNIELGETIEGLLLLVEKHLIKEVGLCNYTKNAMYFIKNRFPDLPLNYAQHEFNLHERYLEHNGTLDFCADNEIEILAYSPLDQGQDAQENYDQKRTITVVCRNYDITKPQLMLAYLSNKTNVTPIVRTTKRAHLIQNVEAIAVPIDINHMHMLDNVFEEPVHQVPVRRIKISLEGEWNRKVYETLEEAIANPLKFSPSPIELSKTIKKEGLLKPVRLKKIDDTDHGYELVAGRIRFWAWVIAHESEDVTISAYIRK